MPKIRRTPKNFVPNSIAREGFVHRHSEIPAHSPDCLLPGTDLAA
jgi:hypothetical protein